MGVIGVQWTRVSDSSDDQGEPKMLLGSLLGGLLSVVVMSDMPASDAADRSQAQLRPFHEIERELRETMLRESQAKNVAARVGAIVDLTLLYRDLVQDMRLETSDTLKGYKAKLWSRLKRIERELERELARGGGRPRDKQHSPAESLAGAGTAVNSEIRGAQLVTEAAGGGALADYGDDLVEIIQATISQSFWDVNGGPGTIVYYRRLQALVVRATADVHHDIGGLFRALRP